MGVLKSLWEMGPEEFWETIYRPQGMWTEFVWKEPFLRHEKLPEHETMEERMDYDPTDEGCFTGYDKETWSRVVAQYIAARKEQLSWWRRWIAEWLGVWG